MHSRVRNILAGAVALALAGGLGLAACGRPSGETVIVILIDTLRRDALGCYGNPQQPTPRIDALAADGVRFENALSTSGWTLPAIASLFTGTWPTIHGAMGKGTAVYPIRPGLPTAAEVFKQQGFNTLAVTNAAFVSPALSMDRGFDYYDHEDAYNVLLRRADKTIDAALELLRKHRGERNFLFVHIFDPHIDYDPPAEYRTRFTNGRDLPSPPLSTPVCLALQQPERRPPLPADIAYVKGVYLGEVAFVDEQVGRFIDELKRMRIYGRSTIVVTADHGEEFWDHGGFEHGHTLYDELVHIPLIVKPPAGARATQPVVATQVRSIDIMPTLFDLQRITPPASFVGVSLMPAIRGEPMSDLTAFCESTMYGPEKLAWRDGTHAYIYDMDPAATEKYSLFDWRADPQEQVNLFARDSNLANRYHQELARFYEAIKREAALLAPTKIMDMGPQQLESLRSLGYIR